jgi:hypothetical protein
MTLDPEVRRTVACVAFMVLAGCPPVVRPEPPGPDPEEAKGLPPARDVAPRKATSSGYGALIGEMCPPGAAGRPGLSPLAVRDVSWSSETDDVVAPLARGSAAQFTVLAVDGRKAGVFASVGTAEAGGATVAIGSYVGSPACSRPSGRTEVTGDASCLAAQKGCGLAVARLGPPGGAFGDGEAPDVAIGGVCRSGEHLAIDVDGDEVTAAAVVAPACPPAFALYNLSPPPGPGVVMDGKHKVDLDVLGVVDVDGDGRREVIAAYRYREGRTIAVYSAMDTAGRLELVGETAPWPAL